MWGRVQYDGKSQLWGDGGASGASGGSGAANQINVIEHARWLYGTTRLDISASLRGELDCDWQVSIYQCSDGVSRLVGRDPIIEWYCYTVSGDQDD